MTTIRVALVDVVVVRGHKDRQVLLMRRATGGRNPGSWESVHGAIDPDEAPVDAARREVHEETGIRGGVLYNLSMVESFYRHERDEVALVPVFACVVDAEAVVVLSEEHDEYLWLDPDVASERASWPRLQRAIASLDRLLPGDGDYSLDDVLKVG